MPKLVEIPEPLRRRLYLPAYGVSEAARYAGVHPTTVARWHYHVGKYKTAVLPGKEKGKPLSYFQLTEVGVVATFRRLGVSLKKIRKARDYVATTLQSEFPFVEYEFQQHGHHMLMELQQAEPDSELDALIIADAAGQMTWSPPVSTRLLEFDYEFDVAMKWHVAGRNSSIVIDPRVSFGAPNVGGIPTWILSGRKIAGESNEEIAQDFGLELHLVKQALAFEGT